MHGIFPTKKAMDNNAAPRDSRSASGTAQAYRDALHIFVGNAPKKMRAEKLRSRIAGDLFALKGWFRIDPKSVKVMTECPVSLADLDVRVRDLAKLVSKRLLLSLPDTYSRVAREYRSLKLKEAIRDLIGRAVKNVPPHPYVRLVKIWKAGGANAAVALEFLQTQAKLSNNQLRPDQVKWDRFNDLFVEYWKSDPQRSSVDHSLKLAAKGMSGSRETIAYAAALEIRLNYWEWAWSWRKCTEELARWIRKGVPASAESIREITETIYCYDIEPFSDRGSPSFMSSLRQIRCRERKKAVKKRDTEK